MRPRLRIHRTAAIGALPVAVVMLGVLALTWAPSASATLPSAPSVATGAPHTVSYGTATLTGSINPHGSDTSYYFQYGATKAYGSQTALADVGAGTTAVKVAVAVAGLQPLTIYHYRIVAVNAGGPKVGADRDFKTTKVPLSLQILTSPNPVVFGGAIQVQGTLSGTDNAHRDVVLQANAFPYSAGFVDVGNPELTTSTGSFSFAVLGLALATQYRVVTATTPPVVSPIAPENVAVQVVAHIGRAKKSHNHTSLRGNRHRLRVYGTVTPAIDGMLVGIMRVSHGHNVLVGGTVLHHDGATHSRFSTVLRVKRGIYRVFVKVTNGSQVSAYSSPLEVR